MVYPLYAYEGSRNRNIFSQAHQRFILKVDGAPIHSRRQRAPFTAQKSQYEGWGWSRRSHRASSTTHVSLHARRQVGKLIRKRIVLPRGVDDLVVLVEWQNSWDLCTLLILEHLNSEFFYRHKEADLYRRNQCIPLFSLIDDITA